VRQYPYDGSVLRWLLLTKPKTKLSDIKQTWENKGRRSRLGRSRRGQQSAAFRVEVARMEGFWHNKTQNIFLCATIVHRTGFVGS
jgi:hypothetical protein